jgi:hypothetical protein
MCRFDPSAFDEERIHKDRALKMEVRKIENKLVKSILKT